MADQREQTKEIGTYILDACEDLTEDDIDCLVAHTNGTLREFFQKELDRRVEKRVEGHYEDFSDMYRPDPQTGDLVFEEDVKNG